MRSSVNLEVTFGQSELHVAINQYMENCDKAKYLQQIEQMLKSDKYDANVLNEKRETVLHMICNNKLLHSASSFEIEDLLNVILRYNIDLNRKNVLGKTALLLACENGLNVVISALLVWTRECEIYLDMDAVDNFGEMASAIAIRTGDKEMLYLLKELRISQRAIFLKAVENEKKELVETILNDTKVNDEKFVKSFNSILYCNAKSWTYRPDYIVDELTWREAMQIAIGRSSKDILRLLLHYDIVMQSQDIQTGDSILHRFFNAPSNSNLGRIYTTGITDSKEMLFLETVLESGLINVNGLNFNGETVLFSVFRQGVGLIRDTTELLLRHKINVNQKNIEGYSALLHAGYQNASILLNWVKETGTWLDIDAKDLNGRTALMIAAKEKQHDVVELLLNAGASVNLSDNRGFTALHHALYEGMSLDQWINFGEFPRNYDNLEKRRKRSEILMKTKEPHGYNGKTRCELNDDEMMKIVNALLTHAEIDVNALDCEGFSPMDIAEALIPEMPSSIRDTLFHKAAVLNVFMPQVKQADGNAAPDFKYDCPLHRLAIRSVEDNVHSDNYYKLSPSFNSQTISTTDERGRSPLHYAIICSRDLLNLGQVAYMLSTMISIGYSINAADFWGRTPLHYAVRNSHRNHLIQIGADQTLKDRDGISAIEMSKMLENNYYANSSYCNKGVFDREEKRRKIIETLHPDDTSSRDVDYIIHWALQRIRKTNPLRLCDMQTNQSTAIHVNNTVPWCIHMNPDTIFQLLRKLGKYAYRHPMAEEIQRKTTVFMEDLALQIKRLDHRFEFRIMPVGSSSEGTKINLPDEYDFNLVLTKFSELCEVSLSPELPTGYVRLKRKQSNIQKAEELDFDSFFNKDGILKTEKVKVRFSILLTNALTNSQFIQSQQYFDWDWHFGNKGLVNVSGSCSKNIKWFTFSDFKIAANLKLNRTKFYAGEKDIVESVSVDIAPCIQVDGWWPEEAITNVSADIKSFGCILVFDRPQRLFQWVPYSESCVRISFGPAESKLIRQSSDAVKEVYMMGKQLIMTKFPDILSCDTSYILKTSLLHCIETSLSKPDMCLKEWMELLMKCYLDFVLMDFCPCYFMPSFCMPNTEYVKYFQSEYSSAMSLLFEKYQNAYMLCHCVSLKASKNIVKMTRLNPIWAHFDREEFISDLLEFPLKSKDKDCVYRNRGSSYCDKRCESVVFRYGGTFFDSRFSSISKKPKEEYEIIYEQ